MREKFGTLSDLCDFCESKLGFKQDKIDLILSADTKGIDIQTIFTIANPKLSTEQMEAFINSAEADIISKEALKEGITKAIELELPPDSIERYCFLVESGVTIDNALNRCRGEFIGSKELDMDEFGNDTAREDRSIEKIRRIASMISGYEGYRDSKNIDDEELDIA